jgi:hypothetical protein
VGTSAGAFLFVLAWPSAPSVPVARSAAASFSGPTVAPGGDGSDWIAAVSGKQKTRKKKAAVALARKLAVIAWALLRDDKDWDPKTMIEVTQSFGRMNPSLQETLQTMKPKENNQQLGLMLDIDERIGPRSLLTPFIPRTVNTIDHDELCRSRRRRAH